MIKGWKRAKERDICRNGHAMTEENSYSNNGYLHCRECRKSASINKRNKNGKFIYCAFCGKEHFATSVAKKFCSVQCSGKSSPGDQSKTHGMTYTSEYTTWLSMKDRCLRTKNKKYKDYGGRGITVCERWRDSFENFLADMGRKPSANLSIDRINNDGNYEPGNCRWATQLEQVRNRRPRSGFSNKGLKDAV